MRKIYYSLLVLLLGINTALSAQQTEASNVTTWDGSDTEIKIRIKQKMTFEYTATKSGALYIYAEAEKDSKGQYYTDNMPIGIWGGLYVNGSYDADSPLQDAGAYENGIGAYGWMNVEANHVVRFTITAPDSSAVNPATFTLKSLLFPAPSAGQAPMGSRENPINLSMGAKTALPPYENTLAAFDEDYATYCRFTAPSDGVANISTEEYLVYYIEADKFPAEQPQYVSQDTKTNDHKFIVKNGVDYLVITPNARPITVTLGIDKDGIGASAQYPKAIESFPATIDLKKGGNYYAFSHELIGETNILEVAAAAGWNGTITYMENPTENSTELVADKVSGSAITFTKNVDPRYLKGGNQVIMNFNMTSPNSIENAVTLTLRAPKSGECFDTAIEAALGENTINGPAGNYWYSYSSTKDVVLSFGGGDSIIHVNYAADGIDFRVLENAYRIHADETIYFCIATSKANQTFTVNSKDVEAGDFCDTPVVFELGKRITIKDRGDDVVNFREFTAKEAGFALFTIEETVVINNHWSISFRNGCDTKVLDYETIDVVNDQGKTTSRTLKLPVRAGATYSIEIMSFTIGREVRIKTKFEKAGAGEIRETAIELQNLNDTIKIDYINNAIKWYKVTAENTGFYYIDAKLGYSSSSMTTIVGDNATDGVNATTLEPYLAGYKHAKVYVEAGETLYISTKTGRQNVSRDGEDLYAKEYGANFYLVVKFAKPRPGENATIAIEAVPDTAYTATKSEDAYEQWYIYTIPELTKATITFASTVYNISSLHFYKEDMTSLTLTTTSRKGDYSQVILKNEEDKMVGKTYEFKAADTVRTIYIMVPIITAAEPVIWKITETASEVEEDVEDDNNGDEPGNEGGDKEEGGNEEGDKEEEDENANVDAPQIEAEKAIIYDLLGRRVENPTKGIYTINGVKRIIK